MPENTPNDKAQRRREALEHAQEATASDLVGRAPNRVSIAVNTGSEEEPTYLKVTFQALKRSEYQTLLDEHTPEPTEDAPNPVEDRDALAPVLISKSAVAPKLTKKQAETIWENWPREEAMMMYAAAVQVNIGSRIEFLGNV